MSCDTSYIRLCVRRLRLSVWQRTARGKKKRVGGFPIPPSKSGARRLVRSSSQLSSGAACTRNNTIILRESAVCPRPPQPAAVPSKEDAVQLRRPPAAAHHIHRPSPVAQKKKLFFSAHTSLPSHHAPRRRLPALRTAPRATPRHAARAATGTPSAPPPRARPRALALAFTTLRTGEVGITKAAAGGVGPTTRNCDGFAAFFFGLLVCMSRFARAAVVAVDGIMGSNQLGARRDGTAVVGSLYHPFTAKIGARHHHSLRRLPDAKIHGPHPLLIPPMGNGKKK